MLFELALGVTSGATKGGTVQSLSQDQNEPSHPSPPSPHLKPTATDLKPAMPSGPATVPLLPQDLDKLVRSVEQDPIDPGWLTAYGNLLDLLLAQVRVGSLEEQKRLLATTKKIVPIAHQRALGANLNLPPDMIGKEIQLSR